MLTTETTLKLGKLHWYLLRSQQLMDSLTHELFFVKPEWEIQSSRRTAFGDQVGRDEIDWWVNQKETDLNYLNQQTEAALNAAQILKENAAKLKNLEPSSYDELLLELRNFCERHSAHIGVLYEYVHWLFGKSELAPDMLFTYKVWGSTRRSNRMTQLSETAKNAEEENPEILKRLMEIVLGVFSRSWYQFDFAYCEIKQEMVESDEDYFDPVIVEVPIHAVVRRSTRMIVDEFIEYILFLRDSLRDVINEIGKREDKENLVSSDAFWRSFVDTAIKSCKVESQLWDFKQTLQFWHAPKGGERKSAKVVFAEDVASFANADGGCLIVGVSDKREVIGIGDTALDQENRIKSAHDALKDHFHYPRTIYRLHQVLIKNPQGVEKLCLVVVVARACVPVGVSNGNGGYTYPVRHGTGLIREDPTKLKDARIHDKNDRFDFLSELRQFVRDN